MFSLFQTFYWAFVLSQSFSSLGMKLHIKICLKIDLFFPWHLVLQMGIPTLTTHLPMDNCLFFFLTLHSGYQYMSVRSLEFLCLVILVLKGPQHAMQLHDGSFQNFHIKIRITRLYAQISQLSMSLESTPNMMESHVASIISMYNVHLTFAHFYKQRNNSWGNPTKIFVKGTIFLFFKSIILKLQIWTRLINPFNSSL